MSYRRWIIIAALLFVGGIVFGVVAPPDITGPFARDTLTSLSKLGSILTPFSPFTALLIFAKNALTLLISFMLGPLFCLVPILALTINGWLLGFVSLTVISEKSLGFLLAGVLPHGVFELPALVLGEAAALSFGTTAVVALFKSEERSRLLPSLKQNLRYIMVALTLLLPAAIIETYVTPLLLTF